ncbi:hypothetical protein ACFVZH_02545 [Streptomyces sp. NPDC059534]|uniref:hypothetical protein n=1 Tax=Streptomyces sp. NPDC059534 TaxID=3346859 RepID=UPI00369709C5
MTTPACELHVAAEKLREHATAAETDVDTNPDWYANGVRNGLGGPSGELAAVMGPGVAQAVAQWLAETANEVTAAEGTEYELLAHEPDNSWTAALAVARAINGTAR